MRLNKSKAVKGVISWSQDESALPWFDRTDALDILLNWYKSNEVDKEEFDYLEKWVVDGYFIIPDLIDSDRVEAFRQEVEEIWDRGTAYKGLSISDVKAEDQFHLSLPHEDLLKWTEAKRAVAKRRSNWRVSGLHQFAPAAKSIYEDHRTKKLCEMIFRKIAIPQYSLTFHKGSQQSLHQDTPVFHVYPRNNLIGVWVACEDIKEDAGPLIFFPKSHKEPLFSEFDNYPQTNRRTCNQDVGRRYDEHVRSLSEHFEKQLFLPKKGEALFWHGQLIHGGMSVSNPESTRLSFVVHYMAEGTDVAQKVVGPFNW